MCCGMAMPALAVVQPDAGLVEENLATALVGERPLHLRYLLPEKSLPPVQPSRLIQPERCCLSEEPQPPRSDLLQAIPKPVPPIQPSQLIQPSRSGDVQTARSPRSDLVREPAQGTVESQASVLIQPARDGAAAVGQRPAWLDEKPAQEQQPEEKIAKQAGKPAVSAPVPAKIKVEAFAFEGNQAVPEAELQAALRDLLGQSLDFAGLQQAVDKVGEVYRAQGLWARGVLPEQELADGRVRIRVVEGRPGKLEIQHKYPSVRFPIAKAREYIRHGQTPGEPLNVEALERAVKTLDAVPGVTASVVLEAGKHEGETDVTVRMANTPMAGGSVRLDNYGLRSTGEARASGLLTLDSPLGRGEQFTLQGVYSQGTQMAVLGASLPVGVTGARLSAHLSTMRYTLGEPFEALEGRGLSNSYSLEWMQPLKRSAVFNSSASLSLSRRDYRNETVLGASPDKYIDAINASWQFDRTDSFWRDGNLTTGSFMLTAGVLDIPGSSSDPALGGFTKLGLTLSRLQNLVPGSTLWLSLSGQYAFNNLDSAEKMSLGGATAIRAYPGGEASGDHAGLFTAELRHDIDATTQGILFYDAGSVTLNHNPWIGWDSGNAGKPNRYALRGAGVGLRWLRDGYELNLAMARKIGINPGADADGNDGDGHQRQWRGWVSLSRAY